jgi:pimeloyl-ACP methyl ester carboxylesterase
MTAPGHSFYGYYNPQDLDSLPGSLSQLEDYIATYGPFDVLMGFSAGAVLAAAYLLQKESRRQEHSKAEATDVDADVNVNPYAPIRCAVFLASAESANELRYLGLDEQQAVIQLPTTHIYGATDDTAPTGGGDLSRVCDPSVRTVMIHQGGHEVPRKEALTEAVHAIRRTLLMAASQKETNVRN